MDVATETPEYDEDTADVAYILTDATRKRMPRTPLAHVEIEFETVVATIGASLFKGQEAN